MQKDSSRRRFPLADRVIEVIDDTLTGEVLLDETLKMMKSSEKMSVNSWIDLLSGIYFPPYPWWGYCGLYKRDTSTNSNTFFFYDRRDLEFDEDRIPIETSA